MQLFDSSISKIASLLTCLFLSISNINAQDVALFYNDAYTQIEEGKKFAEGSNIKESLNFLGIEHHTHTNINFDYLSTMNPNGVIVVPELEVKDLTLDMSNQGTQNLKSYIKKGGTVIVIGTIGLKRENDFNCAKLLNSAFGLGLQHDKYDWLVNGSALKTSHGLAKMPAKIRVENSTVTMQGKLPMDARVLYKVASSNEETIAMSVPYGKGQIHYLGWSWWNAKPLGTLDGGWIKVLKELIRPSCEVQVDHDILLTRNENQIATISRDDIQQYEPECIKEYDLTFSQSEFLCHEEGQVEITATWTNANKDVVETTINVLLPACEVPTSERIKGLVIDMENEPLTNVNALEEISEHQSSSNTSGQLDLNINFQTSEYVISLSKEDTYRSRVSTMDYLFLNAYLEGDINELNYYQKIAADVNMDNEINAVDAKIIRELLLKNRTEFPNTDPWVFIKENEDRDLDELNLSLLSYASLEYEANTKEFMVRGIKKGDLGTNEYLRSRNDNSTLIQVNATPNNENLIEITIPKEKIENSDGISINWVWKTSELEILEVNTPEGVYFSENELSKGELLLLGAAKNNNWSDIKITARKLTTTPVYEIIHNGRNLENKIYTQSNNYIADESLTFNFTEESPEFPSIFESSAEFKVYPTIWEDELTIEMNNVTDPTVIITIFSADGRILKTDTYEVSKKIYLKKDQLVNYLGLGFVSISTAHETHTYKIINN